MPKKTEEKAEKKESKKFSQADYEKRILELAKEGFTAEKIGEKLRQEGIHSQKFDKKVSKILKENNMYVNPDLKNVQDKLERVVKHYGKNKQDKRSMREKDRLAAQVRKLKNYFKVPLK